MALMMSLNESMFQSRARRRDPARRRDHRARKPPHRARGRGRGVAAGHRWRPGSRWRRWQRADGRARSASADPARTRPGPGQRRRTATPTPTRLAVAAGLQRRRATRLRRRPSGDISRVRPRAIAAVCARASPAFPIVRRACIDIGSNTTRLLVADCDGDRLLEVHQERAFTHVRRGLTASAGDPRGEDRRGGHGRRRPAPGGARTWRRRRPRRRHRGGPAGGEPRRARCRRSATRAGSRSRSCPPQEEARLAFAGAARTLGYDPAGPLGVVDAGGGSCELVVGTLPDQVSWFASFEVGSGEIADECLRSDPPSAEELSRARARVREVLDGVRPAGHGSGRGRGRQRDVAAPDRRARCSTPTRSPGRWRCWPARARPSWRGGSRSTRTESGSCRPGC